MNHHHHLRILEHRHHHHLPGSPNSANALNERMEVDAAEAKYQISFKTKLWEGLVGRHGDLWLGYTQQSNWQVYNKRFSSPFRETDYEPELLTVFRTNLDVGAGFKVKMMSLGFNHQSNGRALPLSRSWNRLVAQVADAQLDRQHARHKDAQRLAHKQSEKHPPRHRLQQNLAQLHK